MGSPRQQYPELEYKGLQIERSGQEEHTTLRYVGSKDACMRMKEDLAVGSFSEAGYGTLKNIRVSQEQGPFWNVELEYTLTLMADGSTGTGTSDGPEQSSLTMSMMQVPLEVNSKYRYKWNHALAAGALSGATMPTYPFAGYDDVVSGYTPAQNQSSPVVWQWLQDQGQLPLPGTNKRVWKIIRDKSKPGRQYYQIPVYTIEQHSRHYRKAQASWAVAVRAGHAYSPRTGDFGICSRFGGQWLCQGGSISFDGKWWVATLTYTWSPDGWDSDLYHKDVYDTH